MNPLLKIEIYTNEKCESLTILKPENWIELQGGEQFALPSIKFVYNGVNGVERKINSKSVKVTTYGVEKYKDYVVNYPFSKHSFYTSEDFILAKMHFTRALANKDVYVYLIKTYPTELVNTLSSMINGDMQPLRELLGNAILKSKIRLDKNGDGVVSFGNLNPGDYIVVAMLNKHDENNITLVSTTAFEILEHKSRLNVDSSITRTSQSEYEYLEGEFEIVGGNNSNYVCLAALIKKDVEVTFELTSNGTKSSTNLVAKIGSAGGAKLVEGLKIAGVGLKKVNVNTITNWLNALPSNSVGFSVDRIKGGSYKFKVLLNGLSDGDYLLYVVAWDSTNPMNRIVAAKWSQVEVRTT